MTCICLRREEIGPSVPREYASWLVEDWQRDCPTHRDCEHDPRGGMCYRCAPWMFPSPEEVAANWARFRAAREARYVPTVQEARAS